MVMAAVVGRGGGLQLVLQLPRKSFTAWELAQEPRFLLLAEQSP